MDITKFRPNNGERYIIVENGQPIMVLLSFEDFQKHFHFSGNPGNTDDGQRELPSFIEESSQPENQLENKAELKLEDLPF